jgi:hypothetical protein
MCKSIPDIRKLDWSAALAHVLNRGETGVDIRRSGARGLFRLIQGGFDLGGVGFFAPSLFPIGAGQMPAHLPDQGIKRGRAGCSDALLTLLRRLVRPIGLAPGAISFPAMSHLDYFSRRLIFDD